MTQEADPQAKWHSMVFFFEKLAESRTWKHVQPVAELARKLRVHPEVGLAYAGSSHESLCLHVRDGYHPESPFLSIHPTRSGEAEVTLWSRAGQAKDQQRCAWHDAMTVVEQAWRKLHADSGAALG